MNFIKKIFKKEQVEEKEPVVKSQKEPKRTMPEVNGKELYKKEKEERKRRAQEKRVLEAKQKAAEEKEEFERLEAEKLAKAQEAKLKQENEVKEESKKEEVFVEVKEDEKLDLYGFEIVELKKGDIVELEVLAEERDKFICQAVSNSQNVLLPKIEIEDAVVNVGDTVEVLIFKFYADEYYASVRRLKNKLKLAEELSKVEESQVVSGKVISFKKPIFLVELENGLIGKVFIRNMDTKFVNEPSPYLENTYDFIVVSKDENSRDIQFELDRKTLLNKAQEEILSNIAVDQVLEISDYTFNKGGMEFYYNSVRGFVPISELSYKYYKSSEEAQQDFTGPVNIMIKEIQQNKGHVNILGSIKALLKSPFEELTEKYSVGDKFEGNIVKKENYGLFVNVYENIDGLLHNSEFSSDIATRFKEIKVGDSIEVTIKNIDQDTKRIALTTLEEDTEENQD